MTHLNSGNPIPSSGRFASGTSERFGRLEVMGSKEQLGFSVGASARWFGDIDPGSGYDLHYKNRKFEFVDDEPDGVLVSDGPPEDVPDRWLIDSQGPLDWNAYDADAKFAYQLSDAGTINVAYQLWRQPQTPRYDKIAHANMTSFSSSRKTETCLRHVLFKTDLALIDQLRLTASIHRQKEGRNELLRDATERRQRFDTVSTLGLSAQATSTSLPSQRVVAGGEFYFDTIASQTIKPISIRVSKGGRGQKVDLLTAPDSGCQPLPPGRNACMSASNSHSVGGTPFTTTCRPFGAF